MGKWNRKTVKCCFTVCSCRAVGGLGGLAALAGNLKDPSRFCVERKNVLLESHVQIDFFLCVVDSLLNFFMKTPVANAASNPDNSSRDIYKVCMYIISV